MLLACGFPFLFPFLDGCFAYIFLFLIWCRIVLERPEYGYATYFFELVESFPIDWQIKRLVTAMKLTSCSRATLIENKPLLVYIFFPSFFFCIISWWLCSTLMSFIKWCSYFRIKLKFTAFVEQMLLMAITLVCTFSFGFFYEVKGIQQVEIVLDNSFNFFF